MLHLMLYFYGERGLPPKALPLTPSQPLHTMISQVQLPPQTLFLNEIFRESTGDILNTNM